MTIITSQDPSTPQPAVAIAASAIKQPAKEAGNIRQRAMLDGPILPTLLKLALPTVVVLVVQTLVGVAETYFVSFLGTEAVAGVSLVFPIFMLMQMMSNGGIGGGVASSVARAIGAGKVAEAEALVLNALVLAVVFGVIFAGTEWLFGETVYRLLGGQAGALGAALDYGHTVFLGAVSLIAYLRSAKTALRLPFDLRLIQWRLLGDILRVGGLSAVGTIQANLTVVLVTGAVGRFGTDAIAGYGIASRLDYLQIPLLFALGSAALTMVGVNIGAGRIKRAERVAWIAAFFAAGVAQLLGLVVALFPNVWLMLFSSRAEVLAAGATYFRVVAPFYGLTGLGMLLYFAGQGAGRVVWPVLGGTVRLLVAAGIGWVVVADLGGGLEQLFIAVAAGSILFGAIIATALWLRGWGPRLARGSPPRD